MVGECLVQAAAGHPDMVELLNQGDLGDSAQSIELQPGTLEGVAVWMRHTAASTNNFYVRIVYTEETP